MTSFVGAATVTIQPVTSPAPVEPSPRWRRRSTEQVSTVDAGGSVGRPGVVDHARACCSERSSRDSRSSSGRLGTTGNTSWPLPAQHVGSAARRVAGPPRPQGQRRRGMVADQPRPGVAGSAPRASGGSTRSTGTCSPPWRARPRFGACRPRLRAAVRPAAACRPRRHHAHQRHPECPILVCTVDGADICTVSGGQHPARRTGVSRPGATTQHGRRTRDAVHAGDSGRPRPGHGAIGAHRGCWRTTPRRSGCPGFPRTAPP